MEQRRCDQCGNVALATDVVCWHCGQRLPRLAKEAVAAMAGGERSSFLPTAVLAYGGLTLVIFWLALGLMRSLGQRPLLAIDPKAPIQREWAIITDSQEQFTLSLPSEWVWAERRSSEQAHDFAALMGESKLWATAVAPLDPTTILLAATQPTDDSPGTSQPILAVARNVELHTLSLDQITALITANDPTALLESKSSLNFLDQTQHQLTLQTSQDGTPFECAQQITIQPQNSYLVTICLPTAQFRRSLATVRSILDSFQIIGTVSNDDQSR